MVLFGPSLRAWQTFLEFVWWKSSPVTRVSDADPWAVGGTPSIFFNHITTGPGLVGIQPPAGRAGAGRSAGGPGGVQPGPARLP